MGIQLSDWVENIVGKGEIARYEQFLLFPQCFQKLSVADPVMYQNKYLWSKGLIATSYNKFSLTHHHTMPHFDALKIYSCGKHCKKRRNCLSQAISPFLTMFSTLYGTYLPF